MTALDPAALRDWIGRTERRVDRVTAAPIAALSATLDRDDPEPRAGTAVPPPWHWLCFTPRTPQHDIGPDGHATFLAKGSSAGAELYVTRLLANGFRFDPTVGTLHGRSDISY